MKPRGSNHYCPGDECGHHKRGKHQALPGGQWQCSHRSTCSADRPDARQLFCKSGLKEYRFKKEINEAEEYLDKVVLMQNLEEQTRFEGSTYKGDLVKNGEILQLQ